VGSGRRFAVRSVEELGVETIIEVTGMVCNFHNGHT
jgi:hypothetical protein